VTIPTNPSELFTPFLPSTYNIPEEEDRLKSFLVDGFSGFSDVINDKKIGTYLSSRETFGGHKIWYANTKITRNGFQTFVYIKSLPNTATQIITVTSSPEYPIQNVNSQLLMWHTWGTASRPATDPDNTVNGTADYFSFSNEGDSRISYTFSNKQIVITTTTDLSAYYGFIVAEYIKAGTNGT